MPTPPRRPKLAPASDAIEQLVPSGAMVALGGMHLHNVPMALVRQLIRSRRRIATLVTSPSASIGADLLIGSGLVDAVVVAYIGLEHHGLAPNFRRAVEQGDPPLRVREAEEAFIIQGLRAAAAGLPMMPLPRGVEGTDLPTLNPSDYRPLQDPFGGPPLLAVPALRPSVALLHAQRADPFGTAELLGSPFTDVLMAYAADHVILQVEEVVDHLGPSSGRSSTIPGFLVDALVVAPMGCHPCASHGRYRIDDDHVRTYVAQCAAGAQSYLARFVDGCADEGRYASALPAGTMDSVCQPAPTSAGGIDPRPTAAERMVVALAAELRDGEVVILGANSALPTLACGLARATFAPNLWWINGGGGGVNPTLAPMAHSSCDAQYTMAEALLDLPAALDLQGRPRIDLFFAGGLQVDAWGNCNLIGVGDQQRPTLRGPGSAGLSMAARAGRVVLYLTRHDVRTLVARVDAVSAAGHGPPGSTRVREFLGGGPVTLVTPLAVFDFEAPGRRARLHSTVGDATAAEIAACTGFPLHLPPSGVPAVLPEPTPQQRAIMAALDPRGVARHLVL